MPSLTLPTPTGVDLDISQSRAALRRAETIVAALVEAGAPSHAALYAQAAAHRAWCSHAGVFASPALESALAAAAATLSDPPAARARSTRDRPGVLHVATQVEYPVGGHGRLIERWIRSDRSRRHSVVTTLPRHQVPEVLAAAAAASGGQVHRLAPGSASFAARAQHLRQLAAASDVVVLHTHPFDPLPILALAWPNRPPTVYSNHAPHVFWLGRAVADAVLCGRELAKRLCSERRGIPAEACYVVPMPAEPQDEAAGAPRNARREQLGVAGDLLVLTVAAGFKLRPDGHRDLPATVADALASRPGVCWRVVGPEPAGEWAELEKRTQGRLRAVGAQSDRGLYSAADVYLDSYPFASRTAMLDAAAAGLPVLAVTWHPAEAAILGAWGDDVDSALLPFHDAATLGRWLDVLADGQQRSLHGAHTRAALGSSVTGDGWGTRLAGVYDLADRRSRLRRRDGTPPCTATGNTAPDDLDRQLRHLYSLPETQRAVVNWHREETNRGAGTTFPAEEDWLAGCDGLAGLVGEQNLVIRDYEALVAQLQNRLAECQSLGDRR
jgi:hypothetical protein